MPRARDLGIEIGRYPPARLNAITDVAGVTVGHITLIEGAGTRTGATAIIPHQGNVFAEKTRAALAVLNGYGKFVGQSQIDELGEIETPIVLTNTLATGRAVDALRQHTLAQDGNALVTSINAVVGETNDSRLNDIRAARPTVGEIGLALATADSGAVQEGAVGAGTGTVAFGLKGGVGTASRQVGAHVLGVLVQANYGGSLRINGHAHGGRSLEDIRQADVDGSIMIVLATDAGMCARNLKRLATRCFAGLARTGAALSNGSGDYALAFSTSPDANMGNGACDPLFEAAIEATEEAILNALLMADGMEGYDAGQDRPNAVKGLKF